MTDETTLYKIYEVRNDGASYGQGSYLPVWYTELEAAVDQAREMARRFSWCCDYRVEAWYADDGDVLIVWNSLQKVET